MSLRENSSTSESLGPVPGGAELHTVLKLTSRCAISRKRRMGGEERRARRSPPTGPAPSSVDLEEARELVDPPWWFLAREVPTAVLLNHFASATAKWKHALESATYILGFIEHCQWWFKASSVPVSVSILKKVLASDHACPLLKGLVKAGLLQTDGYYVPRERCRHYALTPAARSWPMRRFTASVWLDGRVKDHLRGQQVDLLARNKSLRVLYADLQRFELVGDYFGTLDKLVAEKAPEIRDASAQFLRRALDDLVSGRPRYLSRPSFARIYHPLCVIPSRIRIRHLAADGKRYGGVDVSACMPTCLAGLYPQASPERLKFVSYIQADFYLSLLPTAARHAGDELTRDDVKARTLCELFGPDHMRTWFWAAMNAEFPELCVLIDKVRAPNHCEINRLLQRIESEIVIEDAVPRIKQRLGSVPLLTVHDCVMAPGDALEVVREELTAAFQRRLGFAPKLKVELPELT